MFAFDWARILDCSVLWLPRCQNNLALVASLGVAGEILFQCGDEACLRAGLEHGVDSNHRQRCMSNSDLHGALAQAHIEAHIELSCVAL